MQYGNSAVLLENISDGYFALDTNWRFTYANAKAQKILRKTWQELIGQNIYVVLAAGRGHPFLDKYQEAVATGQVVEAESFVAEYNSWLKSRAVPYSGGLLVFCQDITTERYLRRLPETFSSIRNSLEWITDMDHFIQIIITSLAAGMDCHSAVGCRQEQDRWQIRYVYNQSPDIIGVPLTDSIIPQLTAAIIRRQPVVFEREDSFDAAESGTICARVATLVMPLFVRGDSTIGCLVFDNSPAGFNDAQIEFSQQAMKFIELLLTNAYDITEIKIMEKEMQHLDRLNLVGQLAAGISHEVRNPMTTVRGFLQMLMKKDGCQQYQEYFELMISELDRANSIISEFLSVAKPRQQDCREANINNIIRAIEPLLSSDALAAGKYVVLELGAVHNLYVDEKEIRQLLLNLVRNGLEAMSGTGTIMVRTYEEKEQVILVVQDEGEGIPSHIINRLGTPFLTSKANGTGLGLAVCYGIASRHNAQIDITTGSTGTTVYVKFNKKQV
ncbi:ATP-binding protein [Sporomusa termitida]|uniref:histidine kinase n=1 Tax=Sporomusa termitida TaxID=2377 RepID=A0A517E0C1_9FIRM|nr:ATP-binding protein [Sporomusa termitida]QDR83051.1 Adaptive-response sensory-kinase SasA [Sporomusa termitida]